MIIEDETLNEIYSYLSSVDDMKLTDVLRHLSQTYHLPYETAGEVIKSYNLKYCTHCARRTT